jgi:hypothetical protein
MRHFTFLLFTVCGLILRPLGVRADDSQARTPKEPDRPPASSREVTTVSLLDALRDRRVSATAAGTGDGRMTLSVRNHTKQRLQVILPPGIIAQGATGQFGGMGGMGGGMMGSMGRGSIGSSDGGMIDRMGGADGGTMSGPEGMGGGMAGMGDMGQTPMTTPAAMGMMIPAHMTVFTCGDPDSWEMRTPMMGMGGMRMDGVGGMSGGMRSVPPTELPSAELKPGQTRNLPTMLVSISAPDPELGLKLPEKGERLEIVGDVSEVVRNAEVQKAIKRLAADKAPATIAQLAIWRLGSNLDWNLIAQLSRKWANGYEMTLAKDFVDRLDSWPKSQTETGRLVFWIEATDPGREALAAEMAKSIEGQLVLGLVAQLGVPARPRGPSVACRVRLMATNALVLVSSSDATAAKWVSFGKFAIPFGDDKAKLDQAKFKDTLAEGILNRLVRAGLIKNSSFKIKNKLIHPVLIENASPLILNGIVLRGTASKPGELPLILSGICVPPRKKLTYFATDDLVKNLRLRKGTRVVALDLSGL